MKTVLQTIQSGAPWLEKAGVEQPRLNMEYLLAHVMGCRRMQLYLQFDRPLEEEILAPLRELVRRRAKREPLQHLLGTVEFMGREFKCDSRALIPRPETEELVERILGFYKKTGTPPPSKIVDVGTGSGVIGLSLAHAFPSTEVVLADISAEALSLARENREKTGIPGERARFVLTDLWADMEGGPFDLIAANLPYIAAEEMLVLSEEVKRDPVLALDGGRLGTELITRFLQGLQPHAAPGALVALEIGAGQSPILLRDMTEAGLRDAEAVNDWSGRDRFLFAKAP
ncbi:MAG: protein-(glutamine-N5) methyltransferase, release factor-specific [Verrucomicrobiales bacterium]|nr:protein-(glutamine-N5) methyltransferase, release factor-specific [Verrucomicrobiales bacterium]